jgi:uncharacterized membrane protein YeaQ/YmgE (transglycosylase-associated protein family)
MIILGWIILGLISGVIASKLMNRPGQGLGLDIVLGIVGALMGGWLFNALGSVGVTGFNPWSILVAVIGAMMLILVVHGVRASAAGA